MIYQRGWAAVAPDGRQLLTRRDETDVELWSITGDAVARLARLTPDTEPEPPAVATFGPGPGVITLAWDSRIQPGTGERAAVTRTWTLDRASLVARACRELVQGVREGARAAGVSELTACPASAP